jgi:hypothetical protein
VGSWKAEARCFEPRRELHRPFAMLNKSGITVGIKLLNSSRLGERGGVLDGKPNWHYS